MSIAMYISRLAGRKTFARGIHPHDCKELTSDMPIEVAPVPKSVVVPLVQHIGAPCEAVVKPRQAVTMGEVLGDSKGFVSAPVHSPVNGTTAMSTMVTLPNGRHVAAVPVTSGEENLSGEALREEIFGGDWAIGDIEAYSDEQIVGAIRAAGLVGMGGAGFPSHVKLKRNAEKPVDTLLVNGCECEPYLTADYRVMVEHPEAVIAGVRLAGKAAGAGRIVVAIEDNKPVAIEVMRQAAVGTGVEICPTVTKYPMGGEKQLIIAAVGREVPTGGLPLDCGVVVLNVGTAAAVARAVMRGKPLTHRVVTVSGRGVNRPCNVLAAVGTSYRELLELAGGMKDDAARVISGGPMMGMAVYNLDTPVTKGTSGITVLTHEDVAAEQETACVRCGRCADVCPLNLLPTRIAMAVRNKNWDQARRHYITACMECGCCAYACPASIPLVQIIRAGKAMLPK